MASASRIQSNALLRSWCADLAGTVLSIGSSSDSDGEGRTYREYFPKASRYLTSEPVPDPRCNLVVDVRDMRGIVSDSIDVLFCSGVLEHVDDMIGAVRECHRVLVEGGVLLLGVPFMQPIHRAPEDYWRLTPFGIRYLLRAFTIEALVPIGEEPSATAYWTRARKG